MSNVVAISAGAYHSLGLLSEGQVAAWGENSHGQCTVPDQLTGVIAIAAGAAHSAALTREGAVFVWGDNSAGQTDVPDAAMRDVVKIASGDNHLLALKADGTVAAWGDTLHGAATVPQGLSNVVAIAAGRSLSFALIRSESIPAAVNIENASFLPDGFQLEALTERGTTYFLEITDDMSQPNWRGKPGVPGTGIKQQFNDTGRTAQRFYRLRRY